MNLPKVTDLAVSGKRVLLRLDLDGEPDPNDLRIKAAEETINYLKEKSSLIIILAHKGRPRGKVEENLSLRPFQKIFAKWGARVEENLRFDPGEEDNDPEFCRRLASLGDVYVNEAFGDSHRNHASVVGLPALLPHAAGFRLIQEVENLGKVLENPKRPVVLLLGGMKKDKLDYLEDLQKTVDLILIGGRLPEYLGDQALESVRTQTGPVAVGNLAPDKEEITLHTMERFEKEILKAGTVILAGPMGKYEEEGHGQGTTRILKAAVANQNAFRVAGGGDTEKAITRLGLKISDFDWVSVGGGAMLEFLAKKTLPGIEALAGI